MLAASSSDSDDAPLCQSTPPRKLQARGSSPINERRANFKRKRASLASRNNIAVLEGRSAHSADTAQSLEMVGDEAQRARRGHEKEQRVLEPAEALEQALQHLPVGFAEDFFLGHGASKINRSLAANATAPTAAEAATVAEQIPQSERFASWLRLLRIGFSVLVHGVGSKRELLHAFADQELKPSGIVCVHMHAFDGRFSLVECLKGVLEKVYPDAPRLGSSADALGATVRAAVVASGSRPLCLVAHNLENMPQPHLVVLSGLAASKGVHLIASADSIWAPLAWDSRSLKDFNFCRQEVNTFAGYETEATARHPRGLPPWSGLGHDKRRAPKASLTLVLRSLTNNHRELVQAMAERQLEADCRTGISMSALLKISTDQMIAASVPKLRSLLNELRDHEVVVQRGCSSVVTAQVLFYLPFDEPTLQKLADGKALDSDDEGDENVPGADLGEDEVIM